MNAALFSQYSSVGDGGAGVFVGEVGAGAELVLGSSTGVALTLFSAPWHPQRLSADRHRIDSIFQVISATLAH